MQIVLRFQGILFLIFSVIPYWFGRIADQSQTTASDSAVHGVFSLDGRTPVYSKFRAGVVGILEVDYPNVALNFADRFPSAINPLWILEMGTLFVSFVTNGNKVSATFTPSGVMNYSITRLDPTNIPSTILEKLSVGYESYSMFDAKEIAVSKNIVYQVILEDHHEYIIVLVNDHEIQESKRIKK
jgi:hypothetical protein